MLQDFPTWREWERILDQATLLVARRPGYDTTLPAELEHRSVKLEMLDAPMVDVSATALRRAIAAGESVEGLVSPAVRAYIRDHELYAAG
jgi:nicotinate-nucleotide adenylyltransferase